jgi:hypothetical protein
MEKTRAAMTDASLSTLALICGVTRETVRKRIRQHGIGPAGERRGNETYPIREVVLAVCASHRAPVPQVEQQDPETLPAVARKAWYEAERLRLLLAKEKGELLPLEETRRAFARIYGDMAQFARTLPDVLERDMQMPPEYVERMHELCRRERQRVYDEAVEKAKKP